MHPEYGSNIHLVSVFNYFNILILFLLYAYNNLAKLMEIQQPYAEVSLQVSQQKMVSIE